MQTLSDFLYEKGKKLLREGRVTKEVETSSRIHFTVASSEPHSVIFDKEANRWSCDCQFFTLRQRVCSHILACMLYLEKEKEENAS